MKTQCKEPTLKLDRFGKRFRRPKPQRCSYADLEKFTDGFSEENFIGKFQFGKVFRGDDVERLLPTPLIVKIWDHEGDNEFRFRDELMLLQHEAFGFHPGLVKLYKCCCEGDTLAIVYLLRPNEDVPYALKPIGTVANLVLEDSFTWLWRIKVALRFAFLVKLLHGQNSIRMSLLIRNISAAHIMLDVDYNPTLFDFGMVSGGIFPDRTVASCDYLDWCYGYIDPNYSFAGGWSEKSDVFAFGVLLLMLITKRVHKEKGRLNVDEPFLHQWAQSQYTEKKSIMGNCSLVHHSLEAGPKFVSSDGPRITKIAMQCVEYDPSRRPTMKQVVSYLLKLGVVQDNARHLGFA